MNTDLKNRITDLEKQVLEKREALRKFRFEMTGGKIKNVKLGRNLKKEIARMLTEINKVKYE